MSISIATLGMFNPESGLEITISPPLKVSIDSINLICTLQKFEVAASLSTTKITTKVKNTKLTINLNKDELKLIAKEA